MGRKRKNSNQSNASAAKLLKRMSPEEENCNENQEGIDDQNPNQNALNPLFMIEILPVILNYLDIDNLKECRLACSFWRFEGGKILLKRTKVKLRPFATPYKKKSAEENEQLEFFLNTSGPSALFNSAINNIPDSRLKNILPLVLQQTTFLSLHVSSEHAQGKKIVGFFDLFPHLQILHLESSWGFYMVFSTGSYLSILAKFESLREIRLEFEWFPDNLTNLLLTKAELAVKEIHLQKYASVFFEKYLESGCNWPIETLILDSKSFVLSPELLDTAGAFLEKISGSLKHLRWDCTGSQTLPAEFLVPWANNLLIPSALNRLESFFILCEYSNSSANDFSWLLFTLALQLPNLKNLTLNEVPGAGNLEESIQKWNNHSKALGTSFKSESLEELNICRRPSALKKMDVESLIFFSRRLWPNLKSLWIEHPPNNLPTSGFLLSEWIGLERLDLKFGRMNKKTAANWTNWFTRGKSSKDGSSSQDDANFLLKDLKNLKHLGLWENLQSQWSRIASDFLGENALKFMTQLQSLHLENSNISPQVKEMLKEALGPNVNVEFK